MKKILIISENFPPSPIVGGIRMAMFSKYLPDFGWDPYILSTENNYGSKGTIDIKGLPAEKKITRVLSSQGSKNASFLNSHGLMRLRHILSPEKTNPPNSYFAFKEHSSRVIRHVNPDIILGTAPTLFPLSVSRDMSKVFNIPWIADFRDIIEQTYDGPMKPVQFFRYHRLKLRRNQIIQSSSRVLTVSRSLADTLRVGLKREIDIIPNGYDEDMFNGVKFMSYPTPKFTISYTGRLMDIRLRNPTIFFTALHDLLTEGLMTRSNTEVNFYGTEKEMLEPYVEKHGLADIVHCKDRVSYSKIPAILSASNVLLVVTRFGRKGILTTKLFEYMASGKYILCVPNDKEVIEECLVASNSGTAVSTVQETKQCLTDLFKEWRATGKIESNNINYSYIGGFGRRHITRKLAGILNEVV